jgi:hypothetical protein
MLIELVTMKPMPDALKEQDPGEIQVRGNKVDILLH